MRRIKGFWLLLWLLFGAAAPAVAATRAEAQPAWGGPLWADSFDSLPPAAAGGLTLRGYGLCDFHYATGAVGGGAAMLDWRVSPMFRLSGGMEYVSSRRVSGSLWCEATLAGRLGGRRLTIENRYLWRHYAALDLQEFSGALMAGGWLRHVTLHLGLCNRYMASLVQRSDGGAATVLEPMNVVFAVEPMLWDETGSPKERRRCWNASFCWSNYNDFVIERVANWFFSLKGWWQPTPSLRLSGEAGMHPAGSLNLTAQYDGWFCHAGAEFRI